MNRFLAIVLTMLLVFGFTAIVFAGAVETKGDTKITLGGTLRFRGEVRDNTADFSNDRADYQSYYDTRLRLSLDAQVSPNTTGRIRFESGQTTGGADSDIRDTYTWGINSEGTGTYGEGSGKRGDLRIMEAWIQHKGSGLLGTPAGIKVGHMLLKLGDGLFLDHSRFGDDAIMLFADPTKETQLALINAKFTEGTIASVGTPGATVLGQDDTDTYTLLVSHKGAGFNLGGDITYLNDQNGAGGVGVAKGIHLWNIGLRGDTKVSDITLKADIEVQRGEGGNAPASNTKFKGYAVLLGADVPIGTITLDAAVAMGSGDKNATDTTINTFQTTQTSIQKFTYVYDYRAMTAGVNAPTVGAVSGLGATNTGIANTTYYKIGAAASPVKDVSTKLDLYLLRATKPVSTLFSSKEIGWEVDGKATYAIDKNLNYFVEAGYLFAGDMYKNLTPIVGGVRQDPDNPWAVRHGIELTF